MLKNQEKVKQVGLNIAFYRKDAGLKQSELADKAFISRVQLSRIESPNNKSSASLDTLLSISDALGIDVRELLDFRQKRSTV